MIAYINPEYITEGIIDEFLMEQNDYHNVIQLKHRIASDGGKKNGNGTRKEDRYRIPEDLIYSLFLD